MNERFLFMRMTFLIYKNCRLLKQTAIEKAVVELITESLNLWRNDSVIGDFRHRVRKI